MCGAEKLVNGRTDALVCNLDRGHEPSIHGIRLARHLDPFVRWGDGIRWTAEDERRYQHRYAMWTKSHVRRKYQTQKMWSAGR